MPRKSWGSKTKEREVKGGMMMLWEDALQDTKMPEMIDNSRGWVGRGSQQTHIAEEGIFLETSFSYSHSLSVSFSQTQKNAHMVHTQNNFIQPTYVNKCIQLISLITMVPENILYVVIFFIQSSFGHRVIQTQDVLKVQTSKLVSLGIPYG